MSRKPTLKDARTDWGHFNAMRDEGVGTSEIRETMGEVFAMKSTPGKHSW